MKIAWIYIIRPPHPPRPGHPRRSIGTFVLVSSLPVEEQVRPRTSAPEDPGFTPTIPCSDLSEVRRAAPEPALLTTTSTR